MAGQLPEVSHTIASAKEQIHVWVTPRTALDYSLFRRRPVQLGDDLSPRQEHDCGKHGCMSMVAYHWGAPVQLGVTLPPETVRTVLTKCTGDF